MSVQATPRPKDSFVWDAFVVLMFFLLGPIGFIVSANSLREAQRAERLAGHTLPGVGCLSALYWLHIAIFVLVVGGIALLAVFAGLYTALR